MTHEQAENIIIDARGVALYRPKSFLWLFVPQPDRQPGGEHVNVAELDLVFLRFAVTDAVSDDAPVDFCDEFGEFVHFESMGLQDLQRVPSGLRRYQRVQKVWLGDGVGAVGAGRA